MGRGTLARLEIYIGLFAIAGIFVLAGYGLVSALADRLDPKVRACVERDMKGGVDGKPYQEGEAPALYCFLCRFS